MQVFDSVDPGWDCAAVESALVDTCGSCKTAKSELRTMDLFIVSRSDLVILICSISDGTLVIGCSQLSC
jgi:hypothetical protein